MDHIAIQAEGVVTDLAQQKNKAKLVEIHNQKLMKAKMRHQKHQQQRAAEKKMYQFFN